MLYIIPTPIGNMEDISLRALRIIKSSDIILVENKNNSLKLLNYYNIKLHIKIYNMNNEFKVLPNIINLLQKKKNISLISNAGTPCISDPGFILVRECIKYNINIDCLPGATALIPALIQSGFPINEFIFIGFLPKKKGRINKIQNLSYETRTIVLYESPYRIKKTLYELKIYLGNKKIVICRELTKKFQEIIRGDINYIINHFNHKKPIGEFVIIINSE